MDVVSIIDADFLTAVELIYEAAADPGRWTAALDAIAARFSASGAVLIWQRDDGKFGTIVSDAIADAQRDYVEGGWFARDIRATRGLERGYFFSGNPFGDNHVLSPQEMQTDPFYTQFLARHDLGWFGAVAVSPDPYIAAALSIQRSSKHAPQFSDQEFAIIAQLGRHVEKSLRLSIRLIDAERSNASLVEALANLGVAIFVLDAFERVIFRNQAAGSILGDVIMINNERLVLSSASENEALQKAIGAALRSSPKELLADSKPVLVRRPPTRHPLVIYPISLKPSFDLNRDVVQRARAIVVVIEPRPNEAADPALVREFLGLTLGEARVASLIGAGLAPKDASVKLGIAEETVRTVLKRVFAKTGVGRQSELAALLTRLSLASRFK